MTNQVKLLELAMLIYVSYKQPLMGIVCAAIFIRQMPVEGMVVHKKKPESRLRESDWTHSFRGCNVRQEGA